MERGYEMADKNECYTISEVADLLKVARNTINNWRKKGIIEAIKINTRVLIRKEEVERLLKENTNKNN